MQISRISKILAISLALVGSSSNIAANPYYNSGNSQYSHRSNQDFQSRYDRFGRERQNFNRNYQRQQQAQSYQQRQKQYQKKYQGRYYNGYQQQQAQQYQQRQRQYQQQYDYGYQNQYEDNYEQQQPHYRQIYQARQSAPTELYGDKLCETGQYNCITIKRGQTWHTLFPDENQRDLVKRLNRLNILLRVGMQLAVPKDIATVSKMDLAPFQRKIDSDGKKLIIVNLPKLAWGAFDSTGNLVNWGPVSGGRDFCSDIGKPCNTIRGVFSVFEKKDQHCKSESFPVDHGGGAPMPYCMFFHDGFALHGSHELPGYNASHGCVRMYKEDAKWLNENFVDVPVYAHDKGTEVIVQTAAKSNDIEDNYFAEEKLDEVDDQADYDNFETNDNGDDIDQINY